MADRDIIRTSMMIEPRTLHGGELYWGSFNERVGMTEAPSWDHPIRRIGWHLGKKSFVKTVHLVQVNSYTPVEEYEHGHYVDTFDEPVDVSVYGSANAIPASSWPSEDQVSSAKVLREVELLRSVGAERDEARGL